MKMTSTVAQAETSRAAAAGIVGDAYVASLAVVMTGDGTSQRIDLDGPTFEALLTILQMRQLAFEPRTRAFRPHQANARMLLQRLDRLQGAIEDASSCNPQIMRAAVQLRDIAELSEEVCWALA